MLNKFKGLIIAGMLMVATSLFGVGLTVSSFTGDVQYKVGSADFVSVQVDDNIPEGAIIRVNNPQDSVNLAMPDGSEIQLIGQTSIRVDAILQENKKSAFKLFTGKLFAKVNKKTGQDFTVETDNAVAAVRGTEFGLDLNDFNLVVKNGSVELQDPTGKNPSVTVGPGMFSTFGPGQAFSKPKKAPANLFSQFNQQPEAADTGKPDTDTGTGDTGTIDAGNPDVDVSGGDTPSSTETSETKAPTTDECSSTGFHWSVSTEVIDNVNWNKVLLSPSMKLGNVTLALYLPLYFQNITDIGDRSTWYNGDEWNFGYQPWVSNKTFDIVDMFEDLVLKIRYMGYKSPEGKKNQILFRVGSMPNMTLAHGLLIDNYANDIEFPATRKVGLQYNMDFGKFGFETLIGDVFNLEMYGIHLFFRPFTKSLLGKKISFGISAFADYNPTGLPKEVGSGNVIGYAADMMYPIINLLGTTVNLYAEGGSMGYMLPYQDQVYSKGLGVNAGLKGTILGFIDYKAEYRHTSGGFDVGYVNAFYDVDRSTKIYDLVNNGATNYDGFMIQAGKSWENVGGLSLKFEQLFPSLPTSLADVTNAPNNYVHIEVWVDKCLFKKAYGKIMYDRQDFAPGEFFGKIEGGPNDGKSRFFMSAVITAQVFYEIATSSYVGVTYKNFYDDAGNLTPTFGFETTMGF